MSNWKCWDANVGVIVPIRGGSACHLTRLWQRRLLEQPTPPKGDDSLKGNMYFHAGNKFLEGFVRKILSFLQYNSLAHNMEYPDQCLKLWHRLGYIYLFIIE